MGDSAVAVLDVAFAVAAAPVLVSSGYLFLLCLLSRRTPAPAYGEPRTRFDIIVPAHDEETVIAQTIKSLLAVDYPRDLFRIFVVADNCSDATKDKAEAAGANVLVRVNTELRGKGYALAHAFEHVLAEKKADAVVVVDADTSVDANLLRSFAHRLENGASAVQAEYAVRNPNASWRTRLMVLALALFHVLRSVARERLRVSAGLRGNGMGFSTKLIAEIPHDAFSIVEDVEYAIRLGYAGYRVHFVAETRVYGEMVASEKESRSQRRRWEGGRLELAKRFGLPLLRAAAKKRDGVLLDLAMDILVAPLTWLVLATVVGSALTVAWSFHHAGAWVAAIPWLVSLAFVVLYVLRGVWLAGTGVRGLLDLLWAPVYMIWKIGLALSRPAHKKGEWVRTARENEKNQS
jgi:cellulose synthase/poly-beta-1,6-N-acetylglucosamine synthase-like glycosyltransferase